MNFTYKLYSFVRDVITSPLIINAYVFFNDKSVKHTNWGDDINYFFLKKVCKNRICIHQNSSYSYRFKKTNYLVIGSTINLLCNNQSIVWGAGAISESINLPYLPKKVCAVRGPLTRQYLLNRGVDCPAIYGDPALLLSLYYHPNIKKAYKFGLVLHYKDQDKNTIKRFKEVIPDIHIIDIAHYKNWLHFVNEILACEVILSSSLHGLIIAESYKIPNIWIKLSNKLLGGEFKFHDFFLSINNDREYPLDLSLAINLTDLQQAADLWEAGKIDLTKLIDSCPFDIKKPNEYTLDL